MIPAARLRSLLLVVLLLAARGARADVAPWFGQNFGKIRIDECTLAEQCPGGRLCNRWQCDGDLDKEKFSRRCEDAERNDLYCPNDAPDPGPSLLKRATLVWNDLVSVPWEIGASIASACGLSPDSGGWIAFLLDALVLAAIVRFVRRRRARSAAQRA